MPTHAEIAKRQGERKLRQAGLNTDDSDLKEGLAGTESDDSENDDLLEQQDVNEDDEDDFRAEFRHMQEQLKAVQGRVAPAQQDLEDMRRVAASQRQQLDSQRQTYEDQIKELREQLEQRQSEDIDPADFLSEDERADLDPQVVKALAKMASGLAKRHAPKIDVRSEALRVLQEQEQNRINQHRSLVLSEPKYGLHKLQTLAQDQRFLAWAKKDDNDVDSAVNSLLRANSTDEIERYARILQRKLTRYQEEQKDPASRNLNPAAARTTLADGMRRNPGKQLNEKQMRDKLVEATRLSRSRNPADRAAAHKILDSL